MPLDPRKIRDALDAKGWTQDDLAKRLGLPKSNMSRLLSGRHGTKLAAVEQIADALGVSVTRIISPLR